MSVEQAAAAGVTVAPEKKSLVERVEELVRKDETVRQRGREAAERVIAELRRAEEAATLVASQRKEGARLRAEVAASAKDLGAQTQMQLSQQLRAADDQLKLVGTLITPETGGLFVEAVLGRMNCKLLRDGERFAYKNDYEKFFKKRSILPFLTMVLLSFVFTHSAPLKCLLQMWSMFYFASLALRENILLSNGSHIRRWWIVHHYLSALLSFLLLVWPASSDTYQQFRPVFLIYTIGQLVVQYLQCEYQLARLYKMVALGKANPMDVTGEAGPLHSWAPNIIVLYPFVTGVQSAQLYCAYRLLRMSWTISLAEEWYIPISGILFIILGLGNLLATNDVYIGKWREHRSTQFPPPPPPPPKKDQ